jgi:hypothetical protein
LKRDPNEYRGVFASGPAARQALRPSVRRADWSGDALPAGWRDMSAFSASFSHRCAKRRQASATSEELASLSRRLHSAAWSRQYLAYGDMTTLYTRLGEVAWPQGFLVICASPLCSINSISSQQRIKQIVVIAVFVTVAAPSHRTTPVVGMPGRPVIASRPSR